MNEDLIVEEVPTNNNDEVILDLNNVNSSVNDILEFLKEEKILKEKKEEELKKEQEKLKKQEELNAPQLKKEEEERQQRELEFIQNIETIATNTNAEFTEKTLNDVSTLLQVEIITNGLLIGIVLISFLSKFFISKK